jgi:hypothetical protein
MSVKNLNLPYLMTHPHSFKNSHDFFLSLSSQRISDYRCIQSQMKLLGSSKDLDSRTNLTYIKYKVIDSV